MRTTEPHAQPRRLMPSQLRAIGRALGAEASLTRRAEKSAHIRAHIAGFLFLSALLWHGTPAPPLSPVHAHAPPSEQQDMNRFTRAGAGFVGAIASSSAFAGGTLIHHYDFATDASDLVGTAHGAFFGGASVVDGALLTDGVNDYVEFPVKIIPTSGAFTVALRFKTLTVPTTYMELLSQGCSSCPGFYIGRNLLGKWRYWHDGGAVGTNVAYPPLNEWHHVAVVYVPGTSSRLFVDGIHVASIAPGTMTTSGNPTRLGKQFSPPNNELHHGFIDDVRVYSSALTDSEVAALASPCASDINEDGATDAADLTILLDNWGGSLKQFPRADINGDGTINSADLSLLMNGWNACP